MHEVKRQFLYVLGVIFTVASYLFGIYILIGGAIILLFDGFLGTSKNYPNGLADTGFLLGALPFIAVAVVLFFLGAHLREDNRKLD